MTAAPAAAAARTAALRLASSYGPGLPGDVESVLTTQDTAPAQYIDPVSLGSLIVSIATLAWTIYTDRKRETPPPTPDVIVQHIRAELTEYDGVGSAETGRIASIVVSEVIHAASGEASSH